MVSGILLVPDSLYSETVYGTTDTHRLVQIKYDLA